MMQSPISPSGSDAARHPNLAGSRWIIKIGSAMLTPDGVQLDLEAMNHWCHQIDAMIGAGKQVILVSSGAIAVGMARVGWKVRPHELPLLQAAAAVGQMGLIQAYERAFMSLNRTTAQVLLTNLDLADRRRYLNSRSTMRALLNLGVVPIVNENDTVVNEEIRFGDNDILAAMVANLLDAHVLVILTDQAGFFDRNPRLYPDARLISEADACDATLLQMASPEGNALGRGGMRSKVMAAARAALSGTITIIAHGREPDVLNRLTQGESIGTLLYPCNKDVLAARKRWLMGHMRPRGCVIIDEGAVRKLRKDGASLLPIGIVKIQGAFHRADVVECLDTQGKLVARGLSNYSAGEIHRICGRHSANIESILGYVSEAEVIHRDNMVLV